MDAPTLTIGPVSVRWADTAELAADPEAAVQHTGAAQLQRYRALKGDAAMRFAAGRSLMGELVAEIAGDDGAFVLDSTCLFCGGDHGAPVLAHLPVVLSVSYAGSTVVVAAAHSRGVAALGVDAEPAARQLNAAELGPLFAPQHPPDLAGWTRIEAALKADGRGLRVPPGDVCMRQIAPGALLGGEWLAHLPGRAEALEVATLHTAPGLVLSVAAVAAQRQPRPVPHLSRAAVAVRFR